MSAVLNCTELFSQMPSNKIELIPFGLIAFTTAA